MRRILFLSLALLQPLCGLRSSLQASQPEQIWCGPSGACYHLYMRRLKHSRAQDFCAADGGILSTASGRAELEALQALLRGATAKSPGRSALLWLGLVRKAQHCTMEELPLRGFSWAPASPGLQPAKTGGNESAEETPDWVREPNKSCVVQKCAGLQVTWGASRLESWGLKEQACTRESPGFLCKYGYAGSCPLPPSPETRNLHYTLPSRPQSFPLEFSPPGTVLTLRCPAGREARFTCRLSLGGFRWEGAERGLCSCPRGLWGLSKGACAEPAECEGVDGAFLCLCAWDSHLGSDVRSCAPPPGLGAEIADASSPLPTLPGSRVSPSNCSIHGLKEMLEEESEAFTVEGRNISAPNATGKSVIPTDSSNYAFILITVAVVMLVILVMATLQAFQVCFKSRCCSSSKGKKPYKDGGAMAVVKVAQTDGDLEASATCSDSEQSMAPNKSAEVSQDDDLQPRAGQPEFEQP